MSLFSAESCLLFKIFPRCRNPCCHEIVDFCLFGYTHLGTSLVTSLFSFGDYVCRRSGPYMRRCPLLPQTSASPRRSVTCTEFTSQGTWSLTLASSRRTRRVDWMEYNGMVWYKKLNNFNIKWNPIPKGAMSCLVDNRGKLGCNPVNRKTRNRTGSIFRGGGFLSSIPAVILENSIDTEYLVMCDLDITWDYVMLITLLFHVPSNYLAPLSHLSWSHYRQPLFFPVIGRLLFG